MPRTSAPTQPRRPLARRIALLTAATASLGMVPRIAPAAAAQGCAGPLARAQAGTVCGTSQPVPLNPGQATVNVFRGIRYARAARWQPPEPYTWTGVDTATAAGPVCPQPVSPTAVNPPPQSEDCLYLNVWAPQASAGTDTLPVLVFIHGGAFVTGAGSSPLYDGAYMAAAGNVVVVTLNYRLGPLGFLYLGPSYGAGTNGNFGLLDQREALTWVQNNISAFGGSRGKVTVFGESAGAMSVGFHLFTMRSSNNLFRAAIMESNPMGVVYRDTTRAASDGGVYVDSLCNHAMSGSPCQRTLAWLQSVPLDTVMKVASIYDTTGTIGRIRKGHLAEALPWTPVVDSSLVLQEPYLGYASGMTPKPLVFGMNRDEGMIFAAMAQQKEGALLDPVTYGFLVDGMFPGNGDAVTGYGSVRTGFPYKALLHPRIGVLDRTPSAIAQLITDYAFAAGNLGAANRAYAQRTSGAPVYGYFFQQQPFFNLYPGLAACAPPQPFVCHAYELPYVFNTLAYAQTANGGNSPIQKSDTTMARRMVAAWARFARTLGAPESGWQPYTTNGSVWVLDGTTNGSMSSTLPTTSNATGLWFTIPPLSATK